MITLESAWKLLEQIVWYSFSLHVGFVLGLLKAELESRVE